MKRRIESDQLRYRFKKEIGAYWQAFLDLLYPEADICFYCHEELPDRLEEKRMCQRCRHDVLAWEGTLCQLCGRVVSDAMRCKECERETSFIWARSYGPYQGLIRDAIQRFKFSGEIEWGLILTQYVKTVWDEKFAQVPIDMIVPVPLHADKERERGYNQAEVLAKDLSERVRIPWRPALSRHIHIPSQTTRTRQERLAALEGVFGMDLRYKDEVLGKRILLLDDVYTTGTTVDICSSLLIEAGASQIYVLTVAR